MKKLIWRLEVLAYDLLSLILRVIGFDRASGFGAWLFKIIGPRSSKQKIVMRNLEIAFPELNDTERKNLARKAWDSMGRTFLEFPLMHRVKAPGPRVTVEGLEHLEAVKASGEPCIIVTGHFANWEVMACMLTQSGLDVAITYRRINNPYLDQRVRAKREAYGTQFLIPKSGAAGARHLLAGLKAGQSVALLNDQKFNTGLSLPFFGKAAMTAPGPTRLALQTGATILPLSCKREGSEFVVQVHAPWHPEDVESGVKRIIAFTEERIKEAPAQWFWAHRRWPKSEYS